MLVWGVVFVKVIDDSLHLESNDLGKVDKMMDARFKADRCDTQVLRWGCVTSPQ